MNTKAMLVIALTCACSVVGCVSVEDTRVQLKSNDPEKVKLAKENILKVISSQAFTADLPERYVELVDDNELLGKIMLQTRRSDVIAVALNKMDPSRPGTPNELLLQMMQRSHDESACAAVAKKLDLTQPGIGMTILTKYKKVLSKVSMAERRDVKTHNNESFDTRIIATLNENELHQALEMDGIEYVMKKKMAQRVVAVSMNPDVILPFYGGDKKALIDDKEAVIVKLAGLSDKISDSKLIIKILKAVESPSLRHYIADLGMRAKLLSRLPEDEAVKYAIDEVGNHGVSFWNSNDVLPFDDAITVTKIVKNPNSVVRIVSAILEKIALYQKQCKESWTMSWGKEDIDRANALIKKLPKFDDATVVALICSDATSWTYFIDTVSANIAYDVLVGGKAKSGDLELALVKILPKNRIDMKVYNGARYDDAKKAINERMTPEMKKAVAEAMVKAFTDICKKAKEASKNTFELDGFYLGMTFDDMKVVFSHHFPSLQIKEEIDGEGKDADHVIYVPGQNSPFCYANTRDKKVYQFNFGKKLLKKWYQYDVQTPMEWANAYERDNKIDMKFKLIEKDTTVYEMDMSRSYRVWFHQESYQYKHNFKEYRLTYFGEEKDFTFEGGIGGAIIKSMAAPRFRYVRGDPGSLRVRIERD